MFIPGIDILLSPKPLLYRSIMARAKTQRKVNIGNTPYFSFLLCYIEYRKHGYAKTKYMGLYFTPHIRITIQNADIVVLHVSTYLKNYKTNQHKNLAQYWDHENVSPGAIL